MRRSPRVMLAWVAALVVMLATVRVVSGDLGSLQRRAHSLGADIPVVLAARDLPLGTTLTVGDLYTVKRPSSMVPPDALRDPGAVVGRVVAVAVLRDDVVRTRHLVATGAPGLAAPGIGAVVPVGDRAVHVVVKDGFEPPVGSVVDVLATYDPTLAPAAGTPGIATVVARGARVLAAAGVPADSGADADAAGGSGVTLLTTETEARAVAYAASIGVVALALAPVQSACCGAAAS